ncbi:MAG: hypothetical protein BWY21_00567 [Parcubacteria group bacterium ADurb.Bin216]|nr:MAG: hypothetical protein BWY21_00567 [Parcubacteria group bacterium ADurb.Bin216]
MSFLNQNYDNVKEPKSVPEGEYELRILAAEVKVSANTGGEFLSIKCEILGEAYAKDVNYVIMQPTSSDDEKTRNMKLLRNTRLLEACNLNPATTSNVNELVGCTFWAILGEEESAEYGTQNRIKKLVPRR